MKDCEELEKLLLPYIGDEVIGFFERKFTTSEQEVRVFTPVRLHDRSKQLLN